MKRSLTTRRVIELLESQRISSTRGRHVSWRAKRRVRIERAIGRLEALYAVRRHHNRRAQFGERRRCTLRSVRL
jgi:hypothetical protein